MRYGALLIPKVGWRALLDQARRAEELGFDAVYVDDHIVNPADPAGPWLEPWTALGAIAATTTRVLVGPLVANIVLRHPAVLLSQARSLAEISGGRLDLGVGAGYAATDHSAVDSPVWTYAARLERFHAALSLIRPGVTRLTVAAHAAASVRAAGAYADAWVSYGGFGLSAADHLAVTRRRVDLLASSGRPVRRRLLAGSPAVTADPIWSSLDALTDFVGRYREAGIDEFVFYYPPASPADDLLAALLAAQDPTHR